MVHQKKPTLMDQSFFKIHIANLFQISYILMSYYMQKANFLPQKVFAILKFKTLCSLIGREHFQSQLKN